MQHVILSKGPIQLARHKVVCSALARNCGTGTQLADPTM